MARFAAALAVAVAIAVPAHAGGPSDLPPIVGAGEARLDIEATEPCELAELNAERNFNRRMDIALRVRSVSYDCLDDPADSYWTAGGDDPDTVVTSLEISLNGRPIRVPRRSYASLGDVERVAFDRDGDDYVVILMPDGDESYEAQFFIRDGRLVRRVVSNPDDEDGDREESFVLIVMARVRGPSQLS